MYWKIANTWVFFVFRESFDLVVIFIYTNYRVHLYITSAIIRIINLYQGVAYTMMKANVRLKGIAL